MWKCPLPLFLKGGFRIRHVYKASMHIPIVKYHDEGAYDDTAKHCKRYSLKGRARLLPHYFLT